MSFRDRLSYARLCALSLALTSAACGGDSGTNPDDDTTAPTVTSTTPSNGATGVAANATVTAAFSEDMDLGTINSTTFTVAGVTGTVSSTARTAIFTPATSLNGSTSY